MVVLNMEIISKEMIRPSSPTPHHRITNLKLSFLDQIAPPVYVPLIFFYQNDEPDLKNTNHAQKSQLVKQSLSKILTEFHPVAGRIQENSLVDCNDAGAEFIEARVHTRLTQIIKEPKMEELKQFLPVETLSYQTEKAILSVKITFFDCGGIAVGVCLSHKIADGTSLVAFMNAWAATCRDQVIGSEPSFDMAAHFPPMDLSGASGFTQLKQLAAAGGGGDVKNPTRVEAVSAFIWRHFIDAAKAKAKLLLGDDINKLKTSSFVAVHAGDCDIVNKLRDAIREIDEGYVNKVQNGEYLRLLSKSVDLVKGDDVEICNFSSWCRFPMYEADFGWGKPVWVCTTTLPFKNLVILMSTPCGGGIEAWVNVPRDELNMLQTHYDMLGSVTSMDFVNASN
ncbi:hypothetical protein DH2020_019032 [Rehmannia glutinosa]|uniref:Uncharacterized protein n=1 Tax=Rehmannia glutinosa TaxID=99300 RepID=A0ABR0WPP6_REHGL